MGRFAGTTWRQERGRKRGRREGKCEQEMEVRDPSAVAIISSGPPPSLLKR